MRSKFDEQLQVLHTQLIEMGGLCESAIASAVKGLLEGDRHQAKKAIEYDEQVDRMERDIETLCLKLLLQQQPVARDLRQISAALKMITDMERIGDQCADIAEITRLDNVRADDEKFSIREMAMAVIKMVTDSVDAYVRQDLDLAHAVIGADDEVDRYFDEVKNQLAQLLGKDAERAEYVIDLLMITKYLERIGDHATNIAEWVVFSITGRHEEEEEC